MDPPKINMKRGNIQKSMIRICTINESILNIIQNPYLDPKTPTLSALGFEADVGQVIRGCALILKVLMVQTC